jgi:hypothetical protein
VKKEAGLERSSGFERSDKDKGRLIYGGPFLLKIKKS